jgi:hypothetical protein
MKWLGENGEGNSRGGVEEVKGGIVPSRGLSASGSATATPRRVGML